MTSPCEKILISACLIGNRVRYDARHCLLEDKIFHDWQAQNRLVPLCPEMAGGLPTPRPPAEMEAGNAQRIIDGEARVITRGGDDVTAAFLKGAQAALALAKEHDIKIAVLKEKSPSCGVVHTYDGQFNGHLVAGPGVTSYVLQQHGIRVFSDLQLAEAQVYLKSLERA